MKGIPSGAKARCLCAFDGTAKSRALSKPHLCNLGFWLGQLWRMQAIEHILETLIQPGISGQEFESRALARPHGHNPRQDRLFQSTDGESNLDLGETRQIQMRAGFDEAS